MSAPAPSSPEVEDDRARPECAAPPITDWTLLPFESGSHRPWQIGAAVVAALLLVSLFVRAFVSATGYGLSAGLADPYLWTDLLAALIIAYIATAHAIQRRGVLRDLEELRPVLRGADAQHRARVSEIVCVSPRSLAIAGVVGGLALGVLPAVDATYWLDGRPAFSDPIMIFLSVRNFVTGWLAGHAVLTEVHVTRRYARLGANELEIDLLDLSPLGAFARKGQRGAIVWLVLSTLVSLFWLLSTASDSNVFILTLILGFVTLVFLYPIYGAHQGIRATKRRELDALRAELRSCQRDPSESVARDSRIAALAALYGTVDAAPEWPVDAPALLRFALFALLGLGSWFGSALVERLLDVAIG